MWVRVTLDTWLVVSFLLRKHLAKAFGAAGSAEEKRVNQNQAAFGSGVSGCVARRWIRTCIVQISSAAHVRV